jgi:hypothetical protein
MRAVVEDALAAWSEAPAHVRMMAGAYVGPLLAAIAAMADAIEALEKK